MALPMLSIYDWWHGFNVPLDPTRQSLAWELAGASAGSESSLAVSGATHY